MRRFLILVISLYSFHYSFAQMPDWQQVQVDVVYLASDDLEGRNTGSKGEQIAAQYIISRLASLGCKPGFGDTSYTQTFTFSSNPHEPNKHDRTGRNVAALLDKQAPYTIVIGAHYDHLGYGEKGSLHGGDSAIHNGADDNASGIAAMIRLAEKLSKDTKLAFNVLFVAFSGEELGLYGSKSITSNSPIPLTKINYMINMDMVGRLNAEKTLAVYGVGTHDAWKSIVEKNSMHNITYAYTESGIGPSDHTSFYLKDIPVLHFFTGQHSDYHKPSDDSPKINYQGIVEVSDLIYAIIQDTYSKPKLSFTKTKDNQEERKAASFKVSLGVMPDYVYTGTGMRCDAILEDRPAHKAGMQDGDIIIKLGDTQVKDIYDYMKALGNFKKADKTQIVVIRAGKEMTVDVTF